MSNILPYRGLMRNNTYKLLVEVGIPLHNVPAVGNCDRPLVLYLFQNLVSLILYLCSLLDLLSVRYTEVLDCTMWYCTKVVLCCIVAARYYTVVAQYSTAIAQCCMGLELD
jgi:hypothetical protein